MNVGDTWMTSQEQYGGMLCFFTSEEEVTSFFTCIGYPGESRSVLWSQTLPLGSCLHVRPFTICEIFQSNQYSV